jgi:hypothetical protein
VAVDDRDGATPEKVFTLEPYSYAEARELMRSLDLAEPVAVALVRRGHRTVAQARAFLEATESHDPFEFDSMEEVVARITEAIAQGHRITVHGDYDCDGVCSTAILVRSLRALGADCDWYIPDRLADGYGLTLEGVHRLAARGTSLLVTTDCGIACSDEVEAARRVHQIRLVATHRDDGVVGVSSLYLQRSDQLRMSLWHYRTYIAPRHRMSNLAAQLIFRNRDEMEERFVGGEDTRAGGLLFELEHQRMQHYFNKALWLPADFTFIGENEWGHHVRVHYFPGATVPPPGNPQSD